MDRMKLPVVIDEHCVSEGTRVSSTDAGSPYEFFWSRIAEYFDRVLALARVKGDRAYKGCAEAIANSLLAWSIPRLA